MAGDSNGLDVRKLEEGCGARKGGAVEDTELLTVEPTSEGRCGADIAFGTGGRRDSSGAGSKLQLNNPRSATDSHDHHRITVSNECSTLLHRHDGRAQSCVSSGTDPNTQQKQYTRSVHGS